MQLSGEVVQRDLEVYAQVVVHVTFDDGISGAIRKEAELTGCRERLGSDERECLIPASIEVGVDRGERDDVTGKSWITS